MHYDNKQQVAEEIREIQILTELKLQSDYIKFSVSSVDVCYMNRIAVDNYQQTKHALLLKCILCFKKKSILMYNQIVFSM